MAPKVHCERPEEHQAPSTTGRPSRVVDTTSPQGLPVALGPPVLSNNTTPPSAVQPSEQTNTSPPATADQQLLQDVAMADRESSGPPQSSVDAPPEQAEPEGSPSAAGNGSDEPPAAGSNAQAPSEPEAPPPPAGPMFPQLPGSSAMELDPAPPTSLKISVANKFSILENDPGMQALIEKHTLDDADDERYISETAEYQVVPLNKLPKGAKNKEPKHLYPTYLPCDKRQLVDMTRVFDYRGMDAHTMFNIEKGKKMQDVRSALIHVHGTGSFGTPTYKNKETTSVFCEYQIRPDTQLPMYVLKVRRPRLEGADAQSAGWARLEISAGCLTRTGDAVGVAFAYADDNVTKRMPQDPSLQELAKNKTLFRTDLILWAADNKPTTGATAPRIWHGLKQSELEQMRERSSTGVELSHFEEAILALDTATGLSIYSEVKNEKAAEIFPPCFDYLRAISYATANLGFYWWYFLAGKGVSVDSTEYPFRDPETGKWLPYPRWLITKFSVQYVDGEVKGYTAEHVSEFQRNSQSIEPDEKSALYPFRISMAREYQAKDQAIAALTKRLEGLIMCRINVLASGDYFASLWFESVTKSQQSDTIMPELKKRCNIFVTAKGGVGVKLYGAVCEDILGTRAHCTVRCVPAEANSPLLEDNDQMEAKVIWSVDNKSLNRRMNAITSIAAGHPERKSGVALANIALGVPVPEGQNTAAFSTEHAVDGALHQQILLILEALDCNDMQIEAGRQLLNSKDGISLIWGPPGTGKTKGAMALVVAMVLSGVKVLVTAASNKAVQATARSFEHTLSKLEDDFGKRFGTIGPLEWCTFAGDQFEVDTDSPAAHEVPGFNDDLVAGTPALSAPDEADVSGSSRDIPAEKHDLAWYLREHDLDHEAASATDAEGDTEMNFDPPAAPSKTAPETTDESEHRLDAQMEKSKQQVLAQVIRTAYNNLDQGIADSSFSSKKLQFIDRFSRGKWDANVKAPTESVLNATKYFELLSIIQEANDSDDDIPDETTDKLMADFIAVDHYWVQRYFTECRLVFVTNSASCHPALVLYFQPTLLLIDNASFSMPADSMIPMASHKNSVKHVVLVGDHKQLKPVAFSGGHNEFFQSVQLSLFEKLLEDLVVTRDRVEYNVQYRQNRSLSKFLRKRVYDSFNDDKSVRKDNETRASFRAMMGRVPGWNNRLRVGIANEGNSGIFKGTASACNLSEAKLCLDLASQLIDHGVKPEDITICTPYTGQVRLLGALARATTDVPALLDVHLATVVDMLGDENKIVIFCFVQHHQDDDMTIGTIWQRWLITVATSRARDGLIIIGNFRGWLKAIRSSKPDEFINRTEVRLFRSLTLDLYDMGDVLDQGDIEDAFGGNMVEA